MTARSGNEVQRDSPVRLSAHRGYTNVHVFELDGPVMWHGVPYPAREPDRRKSECPVHQNITAAYFLMGYLFKGFHDEINL
jgi:hypothetical protein